jgi:hypothetical protein
MIGTVVKDSQNPYRTGVLVGNHVEDRFGADLVQKDVSISIEKFDIETMEDTHY